MRWNIVGAFIRNNPFGTEIAFRKGLERIGETVTVVDPGYPDQKFDDDADVTLVFKWLDEGPYREKVRTLRGAKIIYQVDDLRFPHIKDMMYKMLDTCDHALTFDDDGARLALQYGYESAKKLLLTADNTLYRHIPGMQKDIDVCFIGSLTNGPNHKSRVRMLELARRIPRIKIAVASELFDIGKVCELYNRSKIILNHATDVGQPFGQGFGYQCRHFEAGFTKSFLLSNSVVNDSSLVNYMDFTDESSFVDILGDLLFEEDGYREAIAQNFYNELYESHLPEHRARELIQFVRSIK